MTDLPRRAITRSVKLAGLPLGMVGRAAVGAGRRLGGAPAERVTAELQERTARQIFSVLGELKGGAMKVGQALSILEAGMPEELAGPYRATLTKLQDSAPGLPASTVRRIMAEELGPRWHLKFAEFDETPAASASIGQVHRATWKDGREVAVKLQYPGAGEALMGDFTRLARALRLTTSWLPGVDVKPVLDELVARVEDELDYALEARHQRAFARAYRDDPDIRIPDVLHQKGRVLISEWIDGTPMSQVMADGDQTTRDRLGARYLTFLLSGPTRARLLHADPHPGNFRLQDDGRLAVFDFGAVDVMPRGLPRAMGVLIGAAVQEDSTTIRRGLIEEGFISEGDRLDAEDLLDFLWPFAEPLATETFRFSREWFRSHPTRFQDPRSTDVGIGLKFTLPPEYLLIHRVWLGGLGVLSQLEAEVPARGIVEEWVPDADLGDVADAQ